MPAGRPLKFKTKKELQAKIDAYFADCDPHLQKVQIVQSVKENGKWVKDEVVERLQMSKQKPYTITGLAMALDTTRETLLEYEGEVEGRGENSKQFADTIKKAKIRCHNFAEQKLYENNPAGPIFNLKNNYGWKDKSEVEGSGEQKLIVETRMGGVVKNDDNHKD